MPEHPANAGDTAPGLTSRGFSFVLQRDAEGRLGLRAAHHPQYGAIHADWLARELIRRIAAGRRQPLARALGLAKRPDLHIVDATGGLGRDACTLAALGARVTLIERHPLVFQLLQDAQARAIAAHADSASRIHLIHADANAWLRNADIAIDGIYLDPMYPDDGKTALPAKEMQLLRELTGGDADADALLTTARSACPRVVVKRPRTAPPLAGAKATTALHSTQLRFDCYRR